MIHSTAEVAGSASIGHGTRVWNQAQVREHAHLGCNCNIGKGVYIDVGVWIGDKVKIQNWCVLGRGSILESGVFLGPGVVLTNDRVPRAINRDGTLKSDEDWAVDGVRVREGASLCTRAVVMPGVTIGRFAMVGVGAIVNRKVPNHGLMVGSPARRTGYVCYCGRRLRDCEPVDAGIRGYCSYCRDTTLVPADGSA